MTRNTPTPKATAPIRTAFGIFGTWFASTCRSGSEIVIMMPSKKLTNTISQTFLDLVMQLPTFVPIGVIAVSAPKVKNAMPTISSTAPIKKETSILLGIGATVKHSSSTMMVIGRTDAIDS